MKAKDPRKPLLRASVRFRFRSLRLSPIFANPPRKCRPIPPSPSLTPSLPTFTPSCSLVLRPRPPSPSPYSTNSQHSQQFFIRVLDVSREILFLVEFRLNKSLEQSGLWMCRRQTGN